MEKSESSQTIPVVVVLEQRDIVGKFWVVPSWHLEAVLVGENIAFNNTAHSLGTEALAKATADNSLASPAADVSQSTATSKTGRETRSTQSIWPGYSVHLYRDACERYWHALIGERPLVYVVLREDEVDATVEPALVTIDYDEATAHAETDDQVLSADIPRELYQRMEAFVLDHYKPADFSKRKRKKWHAQDPRKQR